MSGVEKFTDLVSDGHTNARNLLQFTLPPHLVDVASQVSNVVRGLTIGQHPIDDLTFDFRQGSYLIKHLGHLPVGVTRHTSLQLST